MRRYQGGNQFINNANSFNYTSNIYYQFKISANADNIKLYLDENFITNYDDLGTGILSGGISLHNYRSNNAAYFDDVRVRKYAEIEPLLIIGPESQNIRINNLKVFLEGTFNENFMNTNLNSLGLIPLSQPYNTEPWNYSCTQNVPEIINPDIVDWVLIELRDAPDAASATTGTRVAREAAFLLNDGTIVGIDGLSPLQFEIPVNQQLFIAIWHRNHLGVLSANVLTQEPGGSYSYDFTSAASQAYGDGQNYLGNGSYGMIAGDANADGIIDLSDKIQIWIPEVGLAGYLNPDLNLDGQVSNPDKNDWWLQNTGAESQVPE